MRLHWSFLKSMEFLIYFKQSMLSVLVPCVMVLVSLSHKWKCFVHNKYVVCLYPVLYTVCSFFVLLFKFMVLSYTLYKSVSRVSCLDTGNSYDYWLENKAMKLHLNRFLCFPFLHIFVQITVAMNNLHCASDVW